MPMPDGSVQRILLTQDVDKLEDCLEYIFTIDTGTDAFLAQMPDYKYGWRPFAGAKPIGHDCPR